MEAIRAWAMQVLPRIRNSCRDDLIAPKQRVRMISLSEQNVRRRLPFFHRMLAQVATAEQQISRDVYGTIPIPGGVHVVEGDRHMEVERIDQPVSVPDCRFPLMPPVIWS